MRILGLVNFGFAELERKKSVGHLGDFTPDRLGKPHHHPIEPTLVGFQGSFWWIFFSKKGPLVVGQVGVLFFWDEILPVVIFRDS